MVVASLKLAIAFLLGAGAVLLWAVVLIVLPMYLALYICRFIPMVGRRHRRRQP